mmetsp:Transcript_22833/g.35866  ORF Transcript_22833/g.35866 Transcript_22833/m.35866 type:complete len:103 (-) Transcript_22833:1725-2033(-)
MKHEADIENVTAETRMKDEIGAVAIKISLSAIHEVERPRVTATDSGTKVVGIAIGTGIVTGTEIVTGIGIMTRLETATRVVIGIAATGEGTTGIETEIAVAI